MNEAQFQDRIVESLRQEGAVVLKFHDEVTAGIPDIFVGCATLGFWLELKFRKPPAKCDTPLRTSLTGTQFATLQRLHRRPCPSGVLVGIEDADPHRRGKPAMPPGRTANEPIRWAVIPTPRLKFLLGECPWTEIPWQSGKVTLKGICDGWLQAADYCRAHLPDTDEGTV